MQTCATLEFVFTMDEIWSCSSKTFCWFCPHHTENTRCAVFAETNYVEFICRKGTSLWMCALLKFVLAVEKHGLSWSEYRQRRPLPRSEKLF